MRRVWAISEESWQDKETMQIAAQLYTLRDFTKTRDGFIECLDKVAEMGYAGVQISAVGCMEGEAPEVSSVEAGNLLKERGLVCCATHRPLSSLIENPEAEAQFHQDLGCHYTAIGSLGPGVDIKNPDDWSSLAARLSSAAAGLEPWGLAVGYHNHAMEWQRIGEKGIHPFEILFAETSDLVEFELDTYWAALAAQDPALLIDRLAGRISMVHVKDLIPVEWSVTYAPVGEGNLDWESILAACEEAGTEWLIVEQDTCLRDPFDCLISSLRFLKSRV